MAAATMGAGGAVEAGWVTATAGADGAEVTTDSGAMTTGTAAGSGSSTERCGRGTGRRAGGGGAGAVSVNKLTIMAGETAGISSEVICSMAQIATICAAPTATPPVGE